MTTLSKTLAVSAIRDGTVIDHIELGNALKIVQILKLTRHHKQLTLGLNLSSSILGYKDIVKIEDRELTPVEANQVAILAPDATINIIHNYEVSEKFQVEIPNYIEALIPCPNSLCISNHENISSLLTVLQRIKNNIQLQCHYCRRIFTQ